MGVFVQYILIRCSSAGIAALIAVCFTAGLAKAQAIEFQGSWVLYQSSFINDSTRKLDYREEPGRNGSVEIRYTKHEKVMIIREKLEEQIIYLGDLRWFFHPPTHFNYGFDCSGMSRDKKSCFITFHFDRKAETNKFANPRFWLEVYWFNGKTTIYHGSMMKYMKDGLIESYRVIAERRERILQERKAMAAEE